MEAASERLTVFCQIFRLQVAPQSATGLGLRPRPAEAQGALKAATAWSGYWSSNWSKYDEKYDKCYRHYYSRGCNRSR